YRCAPFFVALAAVSLSWLALQRAVRFPDSGARPAFLGKWIDEKGPPGNHLRLQLVPRSVPGAPPGVELLEGKGSICGLFGEKDGALIWVYESLDPLRLNVIIGNRAMVAPIRMSDADHMLIRLVPVADVKEWSGRNDFEGPGAVVLT